MFHYHFNLKKILKNEKKITPFLFILSTIDPMNRHPKFCIRIKSKWRDSYQNKGYGHKDVCKDVKQKKNIV